MTTSNFYVVIRDRFANSHEVIGPMRNDNPLSSNVADFQEAGFEVMCHVLDDSAIERERTSPNNEPGLYSRLIKEYEIKTGKKLTQL